MPLAAPRSRATGGSVPTPAPTSRERPPRPARAPRWWSELLLTGVLYAAYSAARLVVRGDVGSALESGRRILRLQESLHLDPERVLNRLLTDHAWLGIPADFAYASLHYLVTPAVLVWLWRLHPVHYRAARTWLACSTVIGLVGFTLLPTAPPRLLESSYGFADTMAQYASSGWWGGEASAPRGLGGLTNQYAAMPSLHVGWALWCGIVMWRSGRARAVRALGVLYPLVTAFVVMGTANHYLMDVIAGAAVMGLGALAVRPALRAADRLAAGRAAPAREPSGGEPEAACPVPAPRRGGRTGLRGPDRIRPQDMRAEGPDPDRVRPDGGRPDGSGPDGPGPVGDGCPEADRRRTAEHGSRI